MHQIAWKSTENTDDASRICAAIQALRERSKDENHNLPKQGSISPWLCLFGHPVRETAPAVTSALTQNKTNKANALEGVFSAQFLAGPAAGLLQ